VSSIRLPAEMETERRNLGLNPPVSSEKDVQNSVLICEQLSSVLLEAQSRAEIGGTVVVERQQVLASIICATRDVGHPFRHRFGMLQLLLQASHFKNGDTANYSRPPADTERILGLDRIG
jgi:hypothetical protein